MSKGKNKNGSKFLRVILIVIATVVLLSAVIVGMCLFNERPAVQSVEAYQTAYSDTIIHVEEDGSVEILPRTAEDCNTGIIFYVGAQIRPSAYIPLLARLAEQGYSCYIPNLTFNMAALEPKAAEQIIRDHAKTEAWYLAGHSMGGLTASGFADDHPDMVSGLILLAAYTNRDMSSAEIPVLSIFGDTDGVMNKTLYEKRKIWNPADFEEYILAGANHAQYGDYGEQHRDNDAVISADEQQDQTAKIILDWLNRHQPDSSITE
ncbi:MAG: alpha/beta fold hydrolase [Eubacteriales bacterium]|nr:alpha/beta fold hydrolase [Eubacteriales bacterium]